MQCPRCNAEETCKAGKQNGKQKYWCSGCCKHFLDHYSPDHNNGKPNYSSGTRDRYWQEQEQDNVGG